MEALVLITTESSKGNALRMAKLLIQKKLAACVSIKQIFSIYMWDDDIEVIMPINKGKVIDTTGAGDLYAGGFIHGLIKNYSLKKCGEIGSICAGHIISQLGSRSYIDFKELIREI